MIYDGGDSLENSAVFMSVTWRNVTRYHHTTTV